MLQSQGLESPLLWTDLFSTPLLEAQLTLFVLYNRDVDLSYFA